LILDAGVFIGLDNPARRRVVVALLQRMQAEDVVPATTDAVLAQAWRDPARQVAMAMVVRAVTVFPFGLAVLADQLDRTILTTDPADMARLGVRHQVL